MWQARHIPGTFPVLLTLISNANIYEQVNEFNSKKGEGGDRQSRPTITVQVVNEATQL